MGSMILKMFAYDAITRKVISKFVETLIAQSFCMPHLVAQFKWSRYKFAGNASFWKKFQKELQNIDTRSSTYKYLSKKIMVLCDLELFVQFKNC